MTSSTRISVLLASLGAATAWAGAPALELTPARAGDPGRKVVTLRELGATMVLSDDVNVADGEKFESINGKVGGVELLFEIKRASPESSQLATWRKKDPNQSHGEKGPRKIVGEATDADGWAMVYEALDSKSGKPVYAGVAYRKAANVVCETGQFAESGLSLEQAKIGLGACLSIAKAK
jgi:hypothetical protein